MEFTHPGAGNDSESHLSRICFLIRILLESSSESDDNKENKISNDIFC